jgi:ankyrin repeat protein
MRATWCDTCLCWWYCSLLEKHKNQPEELNINCMDPLNRTALITAIENENVDLMRILLEWNIDVKVCPSAVWSAVPHTSFSFCITHFRKAIIKINQMFSGIIHSTYF